MAERHLIFGSGTGDGPHTPRGRNGFGHPRTRSFPDYSRAVSRSYPLPPVAELPLFGARQTKSLGERDRSIAEAEALASPGDAPEGGVSSRPSFEVTNAPNR